MNTVAQARSVRWSRLHTLPGGGGNLPSATFKRGVNLGLPSGQDVAKAMRIKNPLTAGRDRLRRDGSPTAPSRRSRPAYVDAALVLHSEGSAGPAWAASGWVRSARPSSSEVFVGLVHGDQNSFLWQDKNWKPTLPSATPGDFTMADLLSFVNDINPIGD